MNMDMKMPPVIREIKGELNTDGDAIKSDVVKRACERWELDSAERKYLCRYFSLLLEDIA